MPSTAPPPLPNPPFPITVLTLQEPVMHQQIFVNLPIENMARSQAFFRALG